MDVRVGESQRREEKKKCGNWEVERDRPQKSLPSFLNVRLGRAYIQVSSNFVPLCGSPFLFLPLPWSYSWAHACRRGQLSAAHLSPDEGIPPHFVPFRSVPRVRSCFTANFAG